MAETLITTDSMELSLKENGNGVIIDMSPAALLQHSSASSAHIHHGLKQESILDEQSSSDIGGGGGPANATSVSPTNLTVLPSPMSILRCERCDSFETNSRAGLLLHMVHCLSSPAQMTSDDNDAENLSMPPTSQSDHASSNGITMANLSSTDTTTSTSMNAVSAAPNGSASSPAASSSSSSSSRKVFECDVCNMKFSNGANMRRHKMRHTGVKPYECRVCQKRFFRKDHLAEHFTTHTKTLPYHCPICNRGFQRQIAMRAHFQNEHVGQHDLVKTCPLCSYRAGSMKSLRIHFFNRHGIDLDNPGPGGTSSLLMALESQASQVAAAAAAAGFVPGLNTVTASAVSASNANANSNSNQNDNNSKESLRSLENATPPMHFLTPHVEISTLTDSGAEMFNGNPTAGAVGGDTHDVKVKVRDVCIDTTAPSAAVSVSVSVPPQEHPIDCNAKSSLPSSTSSSVGSQISISPKSQHHDNHITPSISLIPIKQQEPLADDMSSEMIHSGSGGGGGGGGGGVCGSGGGLKSNDHPMNGCDFSESEFSSSSANTKLNSVIKVSPLKSLLREDLKRRICAKANNRITRNAAAMDNNNKVIQSATTTQNNLTCNSTPICNGTITSTGQESDTTLLNRKQILTCLFCGIEFPDETLYFLHKGCHCDSNPWKCNICGEQCNNVYEFNSHLLSKSHQ